MDTKAAGCVCVCEPAYLMVISALSVWSGSARALAAHSMPQATQHTRVDADMGGAPS